MWNKIKNWWNKKKEEKGTVELIMSRRGFNEFARHCFSIRNTASHNDVIARFETGKGEKVLIKINNNADTRINK